MKISSIYNINITKNTNPYEVKLIWGPGFYNFPYKHLSDRGGGLKEWTNIGKMAEKRI